MRPVILCALALTVIPAAAVAEELEKPRLVLDTGGHTASVREVRYTTEGKQLISLSDDKTIRVWDVATGEALRVLRHPFGQGPGGVRFEENGRYRAELSSNGQQLAVAVNTIDKRQIEKIKKYCNVYINKIDSNKIIGFPEIPDGIITALCFSNDGLQLSLYNSFENTIEIWDIRKLQRIRSTRLDVMPIVAASEAPAGSGITISVASESQYTVTALAYSPDDKLIAVSKGAFAAIISVETGQLKVILRGHQGIVTSVAWRRDGRVLATGGIDKSIRLWGPDGIEFQGFKNLKNKIEFLQFTYESRHLLLVEGDGNEKPGGSIFDLNIGKEQVQFTRHPERLTAGALSPDGSQAATSGGNDHETYLWKTRDGTPVQRLAGRGRAVGGAAWSLDGKSIAWGRVNKGLTLQESEPIERTFILTSLELGDASDSDYYRAQKTIGTLSLQRVGERKIELMSSGLVLRTITTRNPNESQVDDYKALNSNQSISCFALFRRAHDRGAVGTGNSIKLIDISGNETSALDGHDDSVLALAPSPDGRFLLSASSDQTLKVWELERRQLLLTLFFAGNDWVAWTPEGYYAASPGGERLMGWQVNNGPGQMASFYPADKFRKSLYRPDVIRHLLEAGSTEGALALADRERGANSVPTEVGKALPPQVEVTSPRSGTRLKAPELEVKAIAKARESRPLTAMRLLLDGRPYRGQAGVKPFDPPRAGEVRESWSVELEPGTHRLAVQADSAVSQGVSEPVEVTVVAEGRKDEIELPSLYVLAIGVSEYPGDLRLNYSAKDAQAIERAFREKGGSLFRKIETKLLVDSKATRVEMSRGLNWLRQQMTQKDIAIVFFSGHGQQDNEGSLFLLPVDVDTTDLTTTALPEAQLKKALVGMPGRVIALLDACHAGAVGGDRRKGLGGLTDNLVRDLVTDDYGVIVMASSMGREFSLENNAKRQSNFTLALVEGLSGSADTNKDGAVYTNELDSYISDRVKELTKGQQHPVTAKPTSIRSFPLARP
jgi:WD40 repeat protein